MTQRGRNIRAPALLIWGDRDSVIARSDQQVMVEKIEGSRLLVYPGAGHALYWEEPARIASGIEAFITGLLRCMRRPKDPRVSG